MPAVVPSAGKSDGVNEALFSGLVALLILGLIFLPQFFFHAPVPERARKEQ